MHNTFEMLKMDATTWTIRELICMTLAFCDGASVQFYEPFLFILKVPRACLTYSKKRRTQCCKKERPYVVLSSSVISAVQLIILPDTWQLLPKSGFSPRSHNLINTPVVTVSERAEHAVSDAALFGCYLPVRRASCFPLLVNGWELYAWINSHQPV